MVQTCKCGRGKASAYDNKCGNCRSQKQRRNHLKALDVMDQGLTYKDALWQVQLRSR